MKEEEKYTMYRSKGYWTEDNAASLWEKMARLFPDKEALVDSRRRLTWSRANLLTDRLALGLLEMGLERDEPVIAQLPNCIESVLIRRACQKAGLLFSPPGIALRHREMEHLLRLAKAKIVVVPWRFGDFDYCRMINEIKPNLPDLKYVCVIGKEVPSGTIAIEEMLENPREKKYPPDYLQRTRFSPAEVDFIPATTGTTGLPKLSAWIMAGVLFIGRYVQERVKVTGDDVVLCILNNHLGGNVAYCWSTIGYTGSKVVLLEKFDPEEALRLIEREKVTITTGVPTQLIMMLEHPNLHKYDLSSLRVFHYSGAPLAYNIGKLAEERMGCKIVTEYGSMDYGGFAGHGVEMTSEERLLTNGLIAPGTIARVIDEAGKELPCGEVGELLAKGPARAAAGYYNDPEITRTAFDEEGFFHFGDLGKIDERGFVTVVGRKKDMIIRGGQNIYPVEVENLLLTHPKIYNVAVIPMPDPAFGEKACAFVVLKENQTVALEELNSFLLEKKLAKYKLPESLEIRESFPLVGEGKVDKKALAAELVHG